MVFHRQCRRSTELKPEVTPGVKTLSGFFVTVSESNVKQTLLKALIVTDPELAAVAAALSCFAYQLDLALVFFRSFCSSKYRAAMECSLIMRAKIDTYTCVRY